MADADERADLRADVPADEPFDRWVADARAEEASRRRSRERWLAQQAQEEGTFLGALADLAERGVTLVLRLRSGRVVQGRIRVVGVDFVAVVAATGGRGGREAEVLIALGEIAVVRTPPGEQLASGDRPLTGRLTLVEALTRLVADRERVVVALAGDGHIVRGTLWSVGQDLVVVRLDDDSASAAMAYLPLARIAEVSLA
jgi:hypothetical protein